MIINASILKALSNALAWKAICLNHHEPVDHGVMFPTLILDDDDDGDDGDDDDYDNDDDNNDISNDNVIP